MCPTWSRAKIVCQAVRGYGILTLRTLPFLTDMLYRPYNSVTELKWNEFIETHLQPLEAE